jgi:Domain of unknown function (DUF4281)
MYASKTLDSVNLSTVNGAYLGNASLGQFIRVPRQVSCLGVSPFAAISSLGTMHHSRCTPSLTPSFIKTPATISVSRTSLSTNAVFAASGAITSHVTATTILFTASTIFAAILGLFMIFFPSWPKTRQLLTSPWSCVPIAVVYGILLSWSWQPDTFSLILPGNLADGLKGGFNPQFFPSLAGIVTLFSRVATAASLWVHILAINVFAAREIFLDGENQLD